MSAGPRCGTAGWAIGRDLRSAFPASGSSLERYAAVLNCAEINSTFYRLPRASTVARWAASVPEHFRFSMKVPRAATHDKFEQPSRQLLQPFFALREVFAGKLGPVLVQLPPRRVFEPSGAAAFLNTLREVDPEGEVALEPRHVSWFSAKAEALLLRFGVSRVIADPSPAASEAGPAGSPGLLYRRLHGSPRVYYSSYGEDVLGQLTRSIAQAPRGVSQWCIFDNTASGAALANALTLDGLVSSAINPLRR